jgi:uncharacterized membrane protein YgaE (UPF0421/DUF939 family)
VNRNLKARLDVLHQKSRTILNLPKYGLNTIEWHTEHNPYYDPLQLVKDIEDYNSLPRNDDEMETLTSTSKVIVRLLLSKYRIDTRVYDTGENPW